MRKNIAQMTILMVVLFSTRVTAGTASCSLINSHDARMMCFASSTGNSSYCSFIKDRDTKIRCYASLGK